VALDKNSSMVHEAYVARMIDFGMPEMAYRQARTLTGLVSSNGLAWSVLSYVDARRGDMTNAVSEVTLAGRFAPEHPFVQRTAGEIIAWYDLQADKSLLPQHVKSGLEGVRAVLKNRPDYVGAYDTARKAYQSQPAASGQPQSGPVRPGVPSLVETNPPQASLGPVPVAPPTYTYTEPYYYGETVWVDPDPYWWRPVGYFSGFYFVPYSYVFLYHRHGHRHRHHWNHRFARHSIDQLFRQRPPHGGWHRDGRGRSGFYGAPVEPSPSVTGPSWSYLNHPNRLDTGARSPVPGRNPSPGAIWGARSWSGLEGSSVPRWDARTPQPSGKATGRRQPSWSTLGPGRSAPQPPPPRVAPSSRSPSWSTLGSGGGSRSSSGRSSGGSSRSPSWSTLER
jgi:hypothetical protein